MAERQYISKLSAPFGMPIQKHTFRIIRSLLLKWPTVRIPVLKIIEDCISKRRLHCKWGTQWESPNILRRIRILAFKKLRHYEQWCSSDELPHFSMASFSVALSTVSSLSSPLVRSWKLKPPSRLTCFWAACL
eukprot:TRINITY_DN6168_c0_g1_i5.p1 TRINITY_DN6168_c0_g1~~TRINITY_DN6168_c0_g1_i5.p1  ORF type:complete len:133 (+),score=1.86 TRINITY_DN6168_c0_g1_i5:598-996(+)